MPGHSIRFAESAVSDLEAIIDWYTGQGVPDIGSRLVAEIVGRVEQLRTHPDSGRVVPEFEQDALRELIHPPFRIVYRRDPRHVRIVRVWRSERLLDVSAED